MFSSQSIFGWLSVICTFIYKLPQIYKLCKTHETEALSLYSLVIQTLSYVFYIIHGILIMDNPVLFMGIISLIQNSIICILYCIYSNETTDNANKKFNKKNDKNLTVVIN